MKSAPHPAFKRTDNGGINIARKYNRMSLPDDGILLVDIRGFPFLSVSIVCLSRFDDSLFLARSAKTDF